MDKKRAAITAIGTFLPETILSNQDLEKIVETSDEWIKTRTGIEERRIANNNESTSFMGATAARNALQQRGMAPESLDLIIVSTMTPDFLSPSTACLIQGELGATSAAAFDLQAACSGFIYGLKTAQAFIESGAYKRILLVASEKNSAFIDYSDRTTCVLFGDGAGACIIEDANDPSIQQQYLEITFSSIGADGTLPDLFIIPGGASRNPATQKTVENNMHSIKMNGKEVFKHAVRRMEAAAKTCLDEMHIEQQEIRWLVPHQANMRIIEALAKRFEIPQERVATTVAKYANTSSATIPIAIKEIFNSEKVLDNDLFLLVAFGGGLTWGAAILQAGSPNNLCS